MNSDRAKNIRTTTNNLGGALGPNGDVELVIGLDLKAGDSFVMPVKQEVTIFEGEMLHRHQKMGFYGFAELGFGVLDSRRVIAASF